MIRGTVEVKRLKVYAHHGVNPQERVVGNEFEVSVTLTYPSVRVAETDLAPMAVDYAEVAEIINKEMSVPSSLLENAAWRIRRAILARFPEIDRGSIRVAKLTPPMPGQMQEAAATIEWD